MAIRRKSLIIVSLTLACLIGGIYVSSRLIVLSGFVKLEEEFTKRRVSGALAELREKVENLDTKLSDWAIWDDAYTFINDGNKNFIKSNLTDQAFIGLKINHIVFINTAGNIVWGQGFDIEKNKTIPLPLSLKKYLTRGNFLTRHTALQSALSGFLVLPEGPLLVASRPILTSEKKGPIRGTLIFCQSLDVSLIKSSDRLSSLHLSFHMVSDRQLPGEVKAPAFLFSKDEKILVKPLSETLIGGYAAVKDVFGNPLLILTVTQPREIYQSGTRAIHYFLIALVVFGLVFGIVFVMPLEDEIIKREHSENRLARLNESFLGFGVEPFENINRLTRLCGELLRADYALYTRLHENKLCALSQWNTPADFKYMDKPDGHICYDIMKKGGDEVTVIRNLQKTAYAQSDPDVLKYTLHSYAGIPVNFGDSSIGSLSVVYRRDFIPQPEDKRIMGIIASAIRVEENRWQAENGLKLSEERYKKITDSVSDYMYTVYLENGLPVRTSYGPMCSVVTGYTEREFLSNPMLWIEIVPGDEQQIVKEHIQRIYSFQNPEPIEHRIIRKDGRVRWIRNTTVPQYNSPGELIAYDGLITDITEKKLAEQALLESERKLETLLSNLPGMAYRCRNDENWTVEFVSDGCKELTGYLPEELVNNAVVSYAQLILPEDRRYVRDGMRAGYEDKKAYRLIYRISASSGEERWVWEQGRGVFSDDGRLLGLEGFITDITERTRAEERVNEVLNSTRTLLEKLPFGVIVIDMNKKIRQVNTAALEMMGWNSEKDVVNMVCHKFICPNEEGACPVIDLGETVDTSENILLGCDGRKIPILKKVIPVKLGKEEVLLEAFVDITQQKKAEQILIESKKQAEFANRLKSAFLANMSHEIRTPLNAIIGFAELIENTSLDYVQKDYVEVIRESGHMLLALINDILDLSKIEAGEMRLEIIDFDLEYLIRSIIKINSRRVEEKNLELTCAIAGDIPASLRGDSTRIRQILLNLVSNAIKFTERGGITISARLKGTEEKDGRKIHTIEFSVKDTGIGIPKEKHERIFEAFEQGDVSTTRKYGGTGLGLTISRALVSMMGGKMGVESEPGKGSEFFFTLQLAEAAADVGKNIVPLKTDELKGKKVLVVDDSSSDRKITEFYCETLGMQILYQGKSAKEALQWLAEQQGLPDLIISDILMQGMDGYEFAREVKKTEKIRDIKIIALTSDARPGASRMAQEAGFDAYIPRPVTKTNFIKIIQSVLGDQRNDEQRGQVVTRHMSDELECKGLKILVAEDNAVNQKLLQFVLKNLGCEPDLASNGQVAVEKVKTNHYDLVLMDLQMPIMGGCEATRIIRSQVSKTLPVIALTAAAMKEDEENSLASGMNDYITKPVEMHKLKEKIIQWGKRSI